MSRTSLSTLIVSSLLCSLAAAPAWAACGTTTFTPNRLAANGYTYATDPATHNALYVTDPANQQMAVFDLEWGGALASLRYSAGGGVLQNGQPDPSAQELVWGHDPGGMVQPAFFTANSFYNPEQAGDIGQTGDFGRGSPLFGAACKNDSMLLIMSATTEFWKNDPSWGTDMNFDRAATIYRGAPRSDMWMPPYTVTLTASFVPNPGGSPAYYLKLDYYWHSTDVLEDFGGANWSFGVYTPGTTDPPVNGAYNPQYGANSFKYSAIYPQCQSGCSANLNSKVLVGLYPTSDLKQGVAVSVNPSVYLANLTFSQTGAVFDTFWNDGATGMAASGWAYSPGTGRRFVGYLLAGDWSQAIAFNPQ